MPNQYPLTWIPPFFVCSSRSMVFGGVVVKKAPKAKKWASTPTWQFYLLGECMCWHPLDNQIEEPNSQPGNLHRRNVKLRNQFKNLPGCPIFILQYCLPGLSVTSNWWVFSVNSIKNKINCMNQEIINISLTKWMKINDSAWIWRLFRIWHRRDKTVALCHTNNEVLWYLIT